MGDLGGWLGECGLDTYQAMLVGEGYETLNDLLILSSADVQEVR